MVSHVSSRDALSWIHGSRTSQGESIGKSCKQRDRRISRNPASKTAMQQDELVETRRDINEMRGVAPCVLFSFPTEWR